MASVQKIRDNLFSVSWSFRPTTDSQHTEEVNNPDIFKYCNLNFTSYGGVGVRNGGFLGIEFQFAKAVKQANTKETLVHASKNCIKQKMTFSQSKWTASWNDNLDSCVYCTMRAKCSQCGGKPTVGFEILIDLNPDSPEKGSKHVLEYLLNLWNTKTLSDVTFNCSGKSIKAHTLILASGSPVLAAVFQNDFKEKQGKMVDITDIKANIFESLLQYIYTGKAALVAQVEDATELLVAADKYGVETLKEECALYLSNDIKVENAAQYLVLAHLHNSSVLHEATLQFMSTNAKAVCSRKDWMDIIKNYPELCFQATQLMVGL